MDIEGTEAYTHIHRHTPIQTYFWNIYCNLFHLPNFKISWSRLQISGVPINICICLSNVLLLFRVLFVVVNQYFVLTICSVLQISTVKKKLLAKYNIKHKLLPKILATNSTKRKLFPKSFETAYIVAIK